MKRITIVFLSVFLLLCGLLVVGLRINGTHSEPVGLYWAIGKRPQKGDLVFVTAPSLPIFALAKERGYLNVGFSATAHLIKRLVGIAGDRVTIDAAGVEINGLRLTNSTPLTKDGAGRSLRCFPIRNYILGSHEVLLMSEYSPASFDGRYFGPLQATTIQSVITPILTWN